MNQIEVDKLYTVFIPGEPVPKSTQSPPHIINKYGRMKVIQNDEKYRPLRNTLAYQDYVAQYVVLTHGLPKFHETDPLRIGFEFLKGQHGLGDMKNLEAGVEDGLQYGGIIPNDRQITRRIGSTISFYNTDPGVKVLLGIDDRVHDDGFLFDWFAHRKKAVQEYKEMRGL